MSGHSKWANIKHQKQAKDLVRGNVFSKLSRLITLAVAEGRGITDPENNVKLRLAMDKAKRLNMPKDNIQRAIERGRGLDKGSLKEVIFEAFAPHGIAMIILATTDNANRTLSEVRSVLGRYNGKLAGTGSVSYLFQKCGLVIFDKPKVTEEQVFNFAAATSAFDIDTDEQQFFVYIPFENLGKLREHLDNLNDASSEIDYKPQSTVKLINESDNQNILNLIEALETLDDVHNVFTNLEYK